MFIYIATSQPCVVVMPDNSNQKSNWIINYTDKWYSVISPWEYMPDLFWSNMCHHVVLYWSCSRTNPIVSNRLPYMRYPCLINCNFPNFEAAKIIHYVGYGKWKWKRVIFSGKHNHQVSIIPSAESDRPLRIEFYPLIISMKTNNCDANRDCIASISYRKKMSSNRRMWI